MKFILLAIAIFLCHGLYGQDVEKFENFHGIKQPQSNAEFFEAEGYNIFIQQVDHGLDNKGLSKIQRKYSVKDGDLTVDSVLNIKVLTKTEQENGVMTHFNYYLIPVADKKTTVIGCIRPMERDIELERSFVDAYLSASIPQSIYTKLEIDSINFIGRTIELGPV